MKRVSYSITSTVDVAGGVNAILGAVDNDPPGMGKACRFHPTSCAQCFSSLFHEGALTQSFSGQVRFSAPIARNRGVADKRRRRRT